LSEDRVDLVVVGAGIVGLAAARAVQRRDPGLTVAVLERHDRVAAGQTGHNSGVIHSGIYYRPGSLKARLCREGRARLIEECADRGVEYRLSGKLIVATDEAELGRLDGLLVGTGPDASVSSTVADADPATLHLDVDGTVRASTGCRTFDGEWIDTGDEVLLATFGQRDDSPNVAADGTTTCSDAVVAQEDHVLSVLGDGFRAEVDGDRLTLTSRDGLGLVYRAAQDVVD